MFVQVIQGKVADRDQFKAALDRWFTDLAPGSVGWQSSTAGVTDDGTAIVIVCFESADAARRNGERPEQHQWWMDTSKLFSGEVAFHDSEQVMTYGEAPTRDAGFVQVMQGRIKDPARLAELSEKLSSVMRQERPDVLGWIAALHSDGSGDATEAVYFASEESAREGERHEPSPEARQVMTEQMSQFEVSTYYDVRQPWITLR
jgi:hypothetical protein